MRDMRSRPLHVSNRTIATVWLCGALLVTFSGLGSAQVDVTLTAAPGSVNLAPGQTGSGWFYNGQLPGPVIRVTEGELLRVRFVNLLPEESTVHFHGLPVPSGMDGVPGVSRPPVQPGQEFTYEFVAQPAGTYWFHPHVGVQVDRGLYGALIIDPAGPGDPPFDIEHTVVLDDWLSGPPIPGQEPVYATHLINGKTSLGQVPLNVQPGQQVRLRFLNAAAATSYVVAIDGHPLTVTHADGNRVQPVTVQALAIAPGERYDVLVTANNPGAWSIAAAVYGNRFVTRVRAILQYAGSTLPPPAPAYVPPFLSSGTLLNYTMLAAADPVPPIAAVPDRTHNVTLSGGGPFSYNWFINGQAWPNVTPLPVQYGESVRLNMFSMGGGMGGGMMGGMMPHPMHLHGHFFRVLGTAGGTTSPPLKDTIMVFPGMWGGVQVEFVADNPGTWAYHCHQIYHAEAGMMTLVQYQSGDQDGDGLDDGVDLDPLSPWPVLTTDDGGGGFTLGSTLVLNLQWPLPETAYFHAGVELVPSQDLGDLGFLHLWPVSLLGVSNVGPSATATFPVAIPAVPALAGFRVGFQAIATHATLSPGLRLSTFAAVTLY